ncbi:hypothetical protein [Clostridium butyricum]|uniref:hypothetical protein n=1 Tax=Clostridium butyricum TaxID=1492 RepID=UPI0021054C1B|nr:hypothetical protein [Clostridium butyricum]MCQ2012016.1 hypothetical protein [Clostridium butyricum]MCQ2024446.1 hypothetical protein [Clostridium butyricum]
MSKMKEFQKTAGGTINLDWNLVEEEIGFKLHDNLKDFYSRILGSKNRILGNKNKSGIISGIIKFNLTEFVKRYANKENWLDDTNSNNSYAEFTLCLLERTNDKYILDFIEEAFWGDWTGGKDFGNRAYVGEILINMGQLSLLFNNDTGEFEWVDFGYGNFDTFCHNPYGIVADNTQEFLNKFKAVDIGVQ